MTNMHYRLRNGKNLLWNCLKLACVVEYLSTRSSLIDEGDIQFKNTFEVFDQVASEVAKEKVDRDLLVEKIWPRYVEMYEQFLKK